MSSILIRGTLCAVWLLGLLACTSTTPKSKIWEPDKRADVRAQLAASYMQRNQLTIAREELEQALAIQPDHSRSNHFMALLQERLGDPQQAESRFQRAIRSDPENSQAAHDYGVFLCRRGKVDEALEQFDAALANPLYQRKELTNLRAGECLMTRPDTAEAESYFRRALSVNARLLPALLNMSDIKFNDGNFLSARAYIERYFAVGPETARSLFLASQIEQKLGAQEQATDYATRLRTKFANSAEAQKLKQAQ